MVLDAVCNLLIVSRFAKDRVLRCKRWPFGLHFMTFYSVKGGLSGSSAFLLDEKRNIKSYKINVK